MAIPVKIMDIESESTPISDMTTFKAMVVDPNCLSTTELAKAAKAGANSFFGAASLAAGLREGLRSEIMSARPTYVKAVSPFEIDRVLFNGPATIVFWKNGDKTIVVSKNNEVYDMETDLALCITLRRLGITKVVFDNPTTTATWEDGTETVVKCQEGDVWSKETGLFTVIAKKALGNKGNFNDVFKKHIPTF